ncbi:MAG: polysaccharide biosynthesis tyrosine autokinase [Acidimicrobiia bacterium]
MSTKMYTEASVEMGDYISVIQRRKVLIAAMTLAGLVLALFYSVILANPTYVSHSEVEVKPIVFDPFGGLNLDRELNMGTERELARSDSVAALAKEKLKSDKSLAQLTKKVTVSAVGSTQVLSIDCAQGTRLGAQECSKAFAEAYIDFRRAQATARRDAGRGNVEAALTPINNAIVEAQRRLAAVPPASPQEAEADAVLRGLEDQAAPYRDKLAAYNTLDVTNPGFVVSPANRPGAAASPKPKTNALMGAFFGFFLGLLVAFGRDRVDGRLRGRVDLEEQLRAPVLATVPRTRRSGRSAPTLVTMQHPHSPASEAYRALRTRMLVMAERRGMKTIMVASPSGEDGRTAIAANLAVSLSQVGKRVVLLSADLRKSSVHQYFGLDNERGLSNVLAGEMPPWEAVQEPPGLERLWVFGSGPTPAQPAELLQSDLMRELLAERRKVADFVIIEAPAALDASDCLALAPLVDGILVVADAKHTGREEIVLVREQFEQIGGEVLGAVLSNAAGRR